MTDQQLSAQPIASRPERDVPVPRRRFSTASLLLDYGMVWTLLLVVVGAQIAYPGFGDWANLQNMLGQAAPVGIVAVGMTVASTCPSAESLASAPCSSPTGSTTGASTLPAQLPLPSAA